MKAEVKLTPDELRRLLPRDLREAFDEIVSILVKSTSLSEEEAKALVANEFLTALKGNGRDGGT